MRRRLWLLFCGTPAELMSFLRNLIKKRGGGNMCDDCDPKLEYITSLIRKGFTSGYHPYWDLKADYFVLSDETHMEDIADLVEQGFTSGVDPVWCIEIGDDE